MLNKTIYYLGCLTLAATLALTALAPQAAAMPSADRDDARPEMLADFGQFMASHPWIANKLRENPRLVNNKDFLEDNHELRDWLNDHPAAREEFRADPRGFMRRARDFEAYGRQDGSYGRYSSDGDTTRGEIARFDEFLDGHRDIREQLYRKPSLVNNRDYMEDHPQLRDFLEDHPGVREELRENPRAFMSRLRGFDRREVYGER